jgi:hypothetical protein
MTKIAKFFPNGQKISQTGRKNENFLLSMLKNHNFPYRGKESKFSPIDVKKSIFFPLWVISYKQPIDHLH